MSNPKEMKFRTIVITKPAFFPGEADAIANLLGKEVADLVHIRKPFSAKADFENLIYEIPEELHSRLVVHDHFELADKYGLFGVHINARNPFPPIGWQGCVSRSCHSLEEVTEWKAKVDYVSLSPIFDSISKIGYFSAFSHIELLKAADEGIIDGKVMALGGITFNRLDEVRCMGFGGAMILGDAWRSQDEQNKV